MSKKGKDKCIEEAKKALEVKTKAVEQGKIVKK